MVSTALSGNTTVEPPAAEREKANLPNSRQPWAQAGLLALLLGLVIGVLAWRANWPAATTALAAPVRVDQTQLSAGAGSIDLHARLYSAHAVLADGWFFVAAIGEPEPWNHYLYRSTTIEHALPANGAQEFHWHEPLPVPRGVYQVTIWFHDVSNGQSVHLTGGSFGLTPQLVGGTAPLDEFEGGAAIQLSAQTAGYTNGQLTLPLHARAAAPVKQATLAWTLRPADADQAAPVYTGRPHTLAFANAANHALDLTLADQLALPQGVYDLWLTVDDGDGHPQQAVYRKAVVQTTATPYTRRIAPSAGYRLALDAPPTLHSGTSNAVDVIVTRAPDATGTCALDWALSSDSGALLAHGNSGHCDQPSLFLPSNIDPGTYRLTLTAQAREDDTSTDSDTITTTAEVTP